MKRTIKTVLSCLLISQLFLMTVFAKPDWPTDTWAEAEAGIVMDVDSGTVLFGQKIHEPYPPASITKILTALLVLENSNLDDVITISESAMNNVEPDSGNWLSLEAGDKLSVEDCLYALLLRSNNQIANALAEHVAGTQEAFVQMMNDKVAELGCTKSHFENPSGLNGKTQNVTAYDMALIACAAFQNEKLVEISSTLSYKIPPTMNNPEGRTLENEHKMLKSTESCYYPSAVAGKTGFLKLAGNTLVTYAEDNGRKQVSVILKGSQRSVDLEVSQGQYFLDGRELLKFGFANFKNLNISENETEYITGETPLEVGGNTYQPSDLKIDPEAVITLPDSSEFADAEKTLVTDLPADHPEEAIALISYSYNERKIGTAYLMLKEMPAAAGAKGENAENAETGEGDQQPDEDKDKNQNKKAFRLSPLLIVGIIAVIGIGALATFISIRKKKEAEEVARRREERRRRLKESGDEEAFNRLLEQRKRGK